MKQIWPLTVSVTFFLAQGHTNFIHSINDYFKITEVNIFNKDCVAYKP